MPVGSRLRRSCSACDSQWTCATSLWPGAGGTATRRHENQLWAVLHETNIAHGGEWIECRLLASGPRTNPWFQECGNRVIEAGDLVGFDTDMIGPNGYLADISRTFLCPDQPPSGQQRKLYEIAQEQILTNIDVLQPGMTLRDFSERCWPVPDEYLPNRYMLMVHGAGMVDESPAIPYAVDFADFGYDGVIEESMVLCVESFIGAVGGRRGGARGAGARDGNRCRPDVERTGR